MATPAGRPVTAKDGAEKRTAKDHIRRHLTKTQKRTVCCCFVDKELTLPRTCVILPILLAVALGVSVVLTASTYTLTRTFVQPGLFYEGAPLEVEFVHKFGPWKIEDEFRLTNTLLDFTEIEEAYSGDCSAFTVGSYAKSDCANSLQERCYIYKHGPVAAICLNFLVIPTVFFSASWTTIGMLMLGAIGNVAAFFAVMNNMRDDQSYPENDHSACSYGYAGQFSYNGSDYDTTIRMSDGHEVGSGYTMLLIACILGATAAVLVEFTVDPAVAHQDDLERHHRPPVHQSVRHVRI